MQIFGTLLQENDNRSAIFIRYNALPVLEQWQNYLNTGKHRCIIVKKNAINFIFIICAQNTILELNAQYDDERYCFKALECVTIDSLQSASIEIDKVNHIDQDFEFAIKREGWKYKNNNSVTTTSNLFDEVDALDNYDVVLEELRRQEKIRLRKEEEDKNADKQLDVWYKYVKKEQELLESANKPFALGSSLPIVRKSHVDVEVLPYISIIAENETLNEITEVIGGKAGNDKIEMTLEEFIKWKESDQNEVEADIHGLITLRMKVKCYSHWDAKEFKSDNGYGREFYYGLYDSNSSSIELTYKSSNDDEVLKFYEKVCDSFRFIDTVPPSMVSLTFSLKITTVETDEERKKRIQILSGRDMYSKPDMDGVYLGTLSKDGSDKRHLRIIFPKEKEQRQAAKEFFKTKSKTKLFPGLLKDKILLKRESEALNKLKNPLLLKNESLKEFILNSSRAKTTDEFVGLTSETLVTTPEFIDCYNSQMLSLNPSQQEAVVKGLYAKDLCLLQGPPGTGKTTVISELIWQHIRKKQNVRIMLTSQTNLAIDNALNRLFSNSAIIEGSSSWRNMMLIKPLRKADSEKIEEEGLPFSEERIDDWIAGRDESVSSNNIVNRWMNHIVQRIEYQPEYADVLLDWKSSLENPTLSLRMLFANQYKKDSNVLCMTCGKVDSADFKAYEAGQGFDVVIVDEASKATLPELLMPLCYARKSIIIGDHRQLPPVIFEDDFFKKIREIDPELEANLDKQFKHDIVEESLFKRLITHPYLSSTIKATFNVQYRMHPDINAVISQFYASDSGGLKCGLDINKVDSPDFSDNNSRYHGFSFGRFIQPNVHTIWVDVPDGREQGGEGSSTFNESEVEAVKLVIEALSKADGFDQYMNYWSNCYNSETKITESRIGIISFYAAQVQKIRYAIQSFCDRNGIKVTTKSVDRFQGQESGIVIVSTVRTKRLGFTRTPERLNVALSRARRLLIIIGNSNFYSSEQAKTDEGQYIYRNVIERIKSSGNNDVFIDYRDLKSMLGYE